MTLLLGLACGAVAALPFTLLAQRAAAADRVRPLIVTQRRAVAPLRRRGGRHFPVPLIFGSIARVLGAPRARRDRRRRDDAILRELPVVVDLVGVALGAGCTPFLAVEHATRYGPERSASALRDVSRACALGHSFDDALRELGSSVPMLRPLAEALRASGALGSPAGPALARLAVEVRADARRRAEGRARTVPVRLCFPLVACVLPAFALLTVAPVVLGGLHT
jgi:Flp pilus assembly protein TadB